LLGARTALPDSVVTDLVAVAAGDAHQDVRVLALLGLGLLRPGSAAADLRKIATDENGDPPTRAHAIVALAKSADTAFADWILRKGLSDASADVQRSSVIALGLLAPKNDEATADVLIRRARFASDRPVKNLCLVALGRIGSPA